MLIWWKTPVLVWDLLTPSTHTFIVKSKKQCVCKIVSMISKCINKTNTIPNKCFLIPPLQRHSETVVCIPRELAVMINNKSNCVRYFELQAHSWNGLISCSPGSADFSKNTTPSFERVPTYDSKYIHMQQGHFSLQTVICYHLWIASNHIIILITIIIIIIIKLSHLSLNFANISQPVHCRWILIKTIFPKLICAISFF